MKKTLRFSAWAILLLGLAFSSVSCSDDGPSSETEADKTLVVVDTIHKDAEWVRSLSADPKVKIVSVGSFSEFRAMAVAEQMRDYRQIIAAMEGFDEAQAAEFRINGFKGAEPYEALNKDQKVMVIRGRSTNNNNPLVIVDEAAKDVLLNTASAAQIAFLESRIPEARMEYGYDRIEMNIEKQKDAVSELEKNSKAASEWEILSIISPKEGQTKVWVIDKEDENPAVKSRSTSEVQEVKPIITEKPKLFTLGAQGFMRMMEYRESGATMFESAVGEVRGTKAESERVQIHLLGALKKAKFNSEYNGYPIPFFAEYREVVYINMDSNDESEPESNGHTQVPVTSRLWTTMKLVDTEALPALSEIRTKNKQVAVASTDIDALPACSEIISKGLLAATKGVMVCSSTPNENKEQAVQLRLSKTAASIINVDATPDQVARLNSFISKETYAHNSMKMVSYNEYSQDFVGYFGPNPAFMPMGERISASILAQKGEASKSMSASFNSADIRFLSDDEIPNEFKSDVPAENGLPIIYMLWNRDEKWSTISDAIIHTSTDGDLEYIIKPNIIDPGTLQQAIN